MTEGVIRNMLLPIVIYYMYYEETKEYKNKIRKYAYIILHATHLIE